MANPASNVFPRHCKALPPPVATGAGVYITDNNGKQYLDACGGAAVSCLGHGNRVVIDAVKQQLDTMAYAHTGFFTSEPPLTKYTRSIFEGARSTSIVASCSAGSDVKLSLIHI